MNDKEAILAMLSRMPDSEWLAMEERELAKFERSGSTETLALEVDGESRPVVLLTVRGAKSGQQRRVALMRVEADGSYALVASKGGSLKAPAWYYNLIANPVVQLQDQTTIRSYRAREVTERERELWWKRAVEVHPDFEHYAARTQRIIPVVVLEPANGG
ncbi:nitroreductase family deazaflavin-dependent oxidoreductase [Streptomyces tendae]|uniref:nitroreductase family deazaflavin-dependent oxidoreductase n=1 Tax=Streptomyces tendae TaxID=1932 RepID=UPI003D74468F